MSWISGNSQANDTFMDLRDEIEELNLSLHQAIKLSLKHSNLLVRDMILEGLDVSHHYQNNCEMYVATVLYFKEKNSTVPEAYRIRAFQKAYYLLNNKDYFARFSQDFAQERKEALLREIETLSMV